MSAKSEKPELLFGKMNFILMALGALLVVVGFLLMSGGGNELNAEGYAPEFDESIYSFRRITLSVIVIISGFIVEAIAIMKSFKQA